MSVLDGRDDLARRIERIDRRIGLNGHLLGMVMAMGIGALIARETEDLLGRWAWAAGVLGFFVAGYLFNRDFDRT